MNLFQKGQALLNRLMPTANGVTVEYTRGDATASVAAEFGRTAFRQQAPAPGGAALIWGDRDYLVAVAELARVGLGEPQDGDRIAETIEGQAVVFEVMRPDTGEPAVRFSDNTRTKWRIHTKQVPTDE